MFEKKFKEKAEELKQRNKPFDDFCKANTLAEGTVTLRFKQEKPVREEPCEIRIWKDCYRKGNEFKCDDQWHLQFGGRNSIWSYYLSKQLISDIMNPSKKYGNRKEFFVDLDHDICIPLKDIRKFLSGVLDKIDMESLREYS